MKGAQALARQVDVAVGGRRVLAVGVQGQAQERREVGVEPVLHQGGDDGQQRDAPPADVEVEAQPEPVVAAGLLVLDLQVPVGGLELQAEGGIRLDPPALGGQGGDRLAQEARPAGGALDGVGPGGLQAQGAGRRTPAEGRSPVRPGVSRAAASAGRSRWTRTAPPGARTMLWGRRGDGRDPVPGVVEVEQRSGGSSAPRCQGSPHTRRQARGRPGPRRSP